MAAAAVAKNVGHAGGHRCDQDDDEMVLFLLLVIAAIALGIAGSVVKGLFYLLIIGVVLVLGRC